MKILIIDDSFTVRKYINRILSNIGDFITEECGNGHEGILKCNSFEPDVIFLDWNMPKMNGIEFIKNYRLNGGDAKVIFCTTENEIESIKTAISSGADEYIMKPFDEIMVKNKLSILGICSDDN